MWSIIRVPHMSNNKITHVHLTCHINCITLPINHRYIKRKKWGISQTTPPRAPILHHLVLHFPTRPTYIQQWHFSSLPSSNPKLLHAPLPIILLCHNLEDQSLVNVVEFLCIVSIKTYEIECVFEHEQETPTYKILDQLFLSP